MVFLSKILYQKGHYSPDLIDLYYDFQNNKWILEIKHTKEIKTEYGALIEDITRINIKADQNVKKYLIINHILKQLKAKGEQPKYEVNIPVHTIIIDGVSFMKELHPNTVFLKAQFINGEYWLMFHNEEQWTKGAEMTIWYDYTKQLWVHDKYCDCHPKKKKYKKVQKVTYGKDK